MKKNNEMKEYYVNQLLEIERILPIAKRQGIEKNNNSIYIALRKKKMLYEKILQKF